MPTRSSFTVDVLVHRDFWSEAARQAAAEARRRKAHASAGRAAARGAYGRKDGDQRLEAAVKAHADLHGEEAGRTFSEAAAKHTQRITSRRKAAAASVARRRALTKGAAKRTTKIGRGLLRSMMRSQEQTKLY